MEICSNELRLTRQRRQVDPSVQRLFFLVMKIHHGKSLPACNIQIFAELGIEFLFGIFSRTKGIVSPSREFVLHEFKGATN
ncbi:MAG: hypothetical protein BGO12_02590 [Verrucomicrobia bacterium 61-8]|nr:MAG: hypothetical protein BGO12_02590 [Verrucomicrobia bacterium 61-8]